MLSFQDSISLANLIVLTITALIVFIYTRAAQKSNEIQEKPLINIYFTQSPGVSPSSPIGWITIKNIGKGPAYDLTFTKIELKEGEDTYSYRPNLKESSIEAGAIATVNWFIHTTNGAQAFSMPRFISLIRALPMISFNHRAIFLVNYRGLYGDRYYTIFKFYSTLPAVGTMVMQFVKSGSGRRRRWQALIYCLYIERIKSPAER